jgi:hypothetical protein
VATSTLANRSDPLQLSADRVRPVAPSNHLKPQLEFRVFPTGHAEYHWRIVALTTSEIISRHKSLGFALRKCTSLNKQRVEGAKNATN